LYKTEGALTTDALCGERGHLTFNPNELWGN